MILSHPFQYPQPRKRGGILVAGLLLALFGMDAAEGNASDQAAESRQDEQRAWFSVDEQGSA
jgi:hypothetical protein